MNAGAGILAALCLIAGIFPLFFLAMIDQAVLEMTGCSIAGQLQGGLLPLYTPLAAGSSVIMPQWIPLLMGIVVIIAFAALKVFGRNYSERKYGTWDCGFEALNARMQYSGTAFSKPIRVIFRMIYQSSRDLKVKGEYVYHPETMEYTLKTDSVFEKRIYDPLLKWVTLFSKGIKYKVQTGSVHTYLLYIFIAVLALMLYNKIA